MSTLLPIDEKTLPRSSAFDPPLSDEELEAFCAANGQVRIERESDGVLRMNPPASFDSGRGNFEINGQLYRWWSKHERGAITYSSAGFYLRDGSMRSPDAAYILPETMAATKVVRRSGFYSARPDFVFELLSGSDSLEDLKAKMERWIANGVSLGWLIDPYQREVFIYRAGEPMRVVAGKRLVGDGPVDGFTLDLGRVWRCYEE